MANNIEKINQFNIILASGSPRRRELLSQLDIKFTVETFNVDERFPSDMKVNDVAEFLSKQKIDAYPKEKIDANTIVITADTIVTIDELVLGKAKDKTEAFKILSMLSGKTHSVITGVSIKSKHQEVSFSSETKVKFKVLSEEEINYYIHHYQPFDKAGSYGIQEWIGKIGVEWIEGSFYNVMGLPIQKLYTELCEFT
ncbi:MAG: septum formation protein Maf [Bacteroidales bacterium]|nr:septum formation protein Maf [Bacteroidales bacterium]